MQTQPLTQQPQQQPRTQQLQQPQLQQPQQQLQRYERIDSSRGDVFGRLEHHRLRVYASARRLVVMVHRSPIGHAELRSQAQRAAVSVALNVAEGAALIGAAKKRHYRIAAGSALEVAAAYEVASDIGEGVDVGAVTRLVEEIAAMLAGLLRRR